MELKKTVLLLEGPCLNLCSSISYVELKVHVQPGYPLILFPGPIFRE